MDSWKNIFVLVVIFGAVQTTPQQPTNGVTFVEDLRKSNGQRVIGGWEAEDQQIPHQISLRMINALGTVNSCGGSIIHNEWVITAAHCLANRFTFVVRFGLTNVTRPDYITEATRKYIHPEYNEIQAGVQTADIALLGLDHSIPYGPTIQPCRLQSTEQRNMDYTGALMIISGYGLTDDAVNGGAVSEVLRWVYLYGISNAECQWWYSGSSIVQEPTICAEYYNNTAQSSCSGDSGGPLTVVDEDGITTMVGVASYVSVAGCNSPWPSGYVRPGHYHSWYTEVTGINFDWSRADLKMAASEYLY